MPTPVPPRNEIDLSTFRLVDIKLFACALAVIVAVVGQLLDFALVQLAHTPMEVSVVSNGLTGIVAGLLLYRLLIETRRKQIAFIFRMATLADVNQLAAQAAIVVEDLEVKEEAKRRLADLEVTLQRLRHAVAELIPLADY